MSRMNPEKDCKECFLKGCDCTCATCVAARPRNKTLSRLELTRLSIQAGLAESNASPKTRRRVSTMLKGQGF